MNYVFSGEGEANNEFPKNFHTFHAYALLISSLFFHFLMNR